MEDLKSAARRAKRRLKTDYWKKCKEDADKLRYQGAEITGSDSFAEMLINAKQVAVVPGKAFGADDHVRMSYAISRENIAEGMRRIAEFVSELE